MEQNFMICSYCASEIKERRGRAWADLSEIHIVSVERTTCVTYYPCYLCGVAIEGGARNLTLDFERAPDPEPGADIPDEAVEAAMEVLEAAHVETIRTRAWDSMRTIRLALAAADAKRTELEG